MADFGQEHGYGNRKRGNPAVIAEAESGDTKFPVERMGRAAGGKVSKSPVSNSLERVPGDTPRVRMDRPNRKKGGAAKHKKPHAPVKANPFMKPKAAAAPMEPDMDENVSGPGDMDGDEPAFAKGGGNWIAEATKNKGGLHRSLGIPEGKKIPEKKLKTAEHSKNPKIAKQAQLAETLKGLRK